MADKTSRIAEIVQVMLNTWDLPADCNEGELFTYEDSASHRRIAIDGYPVHLLHRVVNEAGRP